MSAVSETKRKKRRTRRRPRAVPEHALDLLVVSPHPDDAELGMGGTLARAKAEERSTGIIDLTRGEAATKGTPEIRAEEVKAASKVLRLDVRQNLGWPDSRIMDSEDRRLQLGHVLRELRP